MTRELVNLDGKVMEVSEALIYLNNKIESKSIGLNSKLNKIMKSDEDFMLNFVTEIEILIELRKSLKKNKNKLQTYEVQRIISEFKISEEKLDKILKKYFDNY